jgi:hypothetical protein
VDGWVGGRVDCSRVIIKLNSVQLQLQLPAGTELGKKTGCSSILPGKKRRRVLFSKMCEIHLPLSYFSGPRMDGWITIASWSQPLFSDQNAFHINLL